jgi:hypothetical protein
VKFAWIAAEKADYRIRDLCRALDVSVSGYYAWCTRPESVRAQRDRRLTVLVRASFDASKGRYGSPRIHKDLLEQEEYVSRKRVIRLMQEEQLVARQRKRFTCTTMSDHDLPVATNLLDRQFTADGPNQRWVGDTTEFVIGESGKLYLAAILDLYSRFIVGWAVSAVNNRHLTIMSACSASTRSTSSPAKSRVCSGDWSKRGQNCIGRSCRRTGTGSRRAVRRCQSRRYNRAVSRHPLHRVLGFERVGAHTLRVEFADGSTQTIDFRPVLAGELYGPLQDPAVFGQVHLDPEARTLVWPNGADFDPATLHDWPLVVQELTARARAWASRRA